VNKHFRFCNILDSDHLLIVNQHASKYIQLQRQLEFCLDHKKLPQAKSLMLWTWQMLVNQWPLYFDAAECIQS